MTETITFALAFAGFVALAAAAVLAARRHPAKWLLFLTAAVVTAHVILVWAFRYEWSLAQATRNGHLGFTLFHAALLAIILAPVVPVRMARWLTLFAFAAVSIGASGAVFRYDVVALYQIPVIACTALGLIGIGLGFKRPSGLLEAADRAEG